ncbi:type IV secretion system protein VirB10 [Acinetobacter radioresistens]|uniref:type IV secretion system protein VirB10 n=1 Tax=Acinetobacter radioresistens TaxID=40216 RepID=UPI00125FA5DD|nr:type IV secretion system protein VirB10 [Acinetobacter radioresistens]MCU4500845.1 type IV secretion system protein VirB10 [Acinetobacter radioresistens]MCX0331807.1 type IV secretion system protein VirB10 [Acinetobacter radioresistens]
MNINEQKPLDDQKAPDEEFKESENGIVSVNERGDQEDGKGKKIAFIAVMAVLFTVIAVFAYNFFSDSSDADEAAQLKESQIDPSLDASAKRRDFTNTDPVPMDAGQNAQFQSIDACQDKSIPRQLTDNNGNALTYNGMLVFQCQNGQQILRHPEAAPVVEQQAANQPVVIQPQPQQQAQYVPLNNGSRYGGGIFVNSSQQGGAVGQPSSMNQQAAYNQVTGMMKQFEQDQNSNSRSGNFSGSGLMSLAHDDDEPMQQHQPQQATTNMANHSSNKVQARFIGDRNYLIAKGRVIRCNLSVKVVSEIGGMASCVLPQPVYSDNGRVVLAEAGSEVIGEYKSIAAQGQRRLGIIWSRLKTPHGVIVDIDSPAADHLGTGGLSGRVDNRWGARIGAAFMLSLVQDAIAYGISKETGGNNSTPYMLQNTSDMGKSMAETVLNETINIKPTIYKNQGDVASIYVAKDIDFRGVYELRAK